jgi:hypothetical protein
MRIIMELFDVGPAVAISALTGTLLVVGLAMVYFIRSAPPTTITISSGPEGSVFYKTAQKYAKLLERNGVKVNVLTSDGSLQNLQRLEDPSSHVDVGIVQVGINKGSSGAAESDRLVSLGSISYQPLLVFYRGKPIELLSELKGKKVAIGVAGSGSRSFALTLLKANGIKDNGPTELLSWGAGEAATALLEKKIDAAFVMSDSASTDIMRDLLHANDVHLFSFKQAAAYSRKIDSLNVLDLPEGAIDFGLDIPSRDITLLGPMVELIAVKGFHPALSDVLLEAANQVHSRPGIFQRRGEFPAPIEHTIQMSDDAVRYYKSGKSFWYRYLPFWLASLTSRVVVVFIPLLVVLIPVLKTVPTFFRWRIQSRIRRRYRELLDLEREYLFEAELAKQEQLRSRFDKIEEAVNKMRIPARFADQFYALRGHIDYVRQLVARRHA